MLKSRLKEKVNAQHEMSCSSKGGTGTPRGALVQPAQASVGHKLGWPVAGPLQLPLCYPEVDTNDIIKCFVLSKAKVPCSAMSYSLLLTPTPSRVPPRCSPAPLAIVLAIPCPGDQLVPGCVPIRIPPLWGQQECFSPPLPMPLAVQEMGWDLGMKSRLVPSAPTRLRVPARSGHATARAGMSPTSLLP